MVVTLALTLALSPGERELPSCVSGFAEDRPANPVAGFRGRRRTILPLPGGEGWGEGKRETFSKVGTRSTASQTLLLFPRRMGRCGNRPYQTDSAERRRSRRDELRKSLTSQIGDSCNLSLRIHSPPLGIQSAAVCRRAATTRGKEECGFAFPQLTASGGGRNVWGNSST